MSHATFAAPDLTTFAGLDMLGLTVTGQRIDARRAVLECRVIDPDDCCHECGDRARSLGTQSRYLAHEPFGCRPTTLLVRVRRYQCEPCNRYWADDLRAAAEPRAKVSRGGLTWALRALVVDHLSVSRIAAGLGVAWNTANDAVLSEGHRHLINDPTRFCQRRLKIEQVSTGRFQAIVATPGTYGEGISVANTAAGDRPLRTLRGRAFSSSSTARRCAAGWAPRSVPFGK